MNPNYQVYQFYFNVFQFGFMLLVGVYTFWTNREKVTKSRFDAQGKRLVEIETKMLTLPITGCNSHANTTVRLDGHSDRLRQHKELIDKLSAEISHLPKIEDLSRIHQRIDLVSNHTESIKGELKGIAANMDLLLQHHIRSNS